MFGTGEQKSLFSLGMKRLPVFMILALLLLARVGSAGAAGERWLPLVQSTTGTNYYIDANTLHYRTGNTALAWFKLVEEDDSAEFERIRNLVLFGKSFRKYHYTKVFCEIACSGGKLRTLTISAYDRSGDIIHRDETLTSQWIVIPSGSCFDTIRQILCKR
ncbi:MAG: hypothetical protein IT388_08085 [Nitrospirales bacterium]|nr:hypothetical protein [Nitrospirales bacterium]